jgi:hypothetical protein
LLSLRGRPTLVGMDHERLSNGEITKDALQDTVEAAATAVGTVAAVITGAVRDVARAVGTFGTEVFEIRESVRRARRDADE